MPQPSFPCISDSDSTLTRIDKLKESIRIVEALFKAGPVRSNNNSKVDQASPRALVGSCLELTLLAFISNPALISMISQNSY